MAGLRRRQPAAAVRCHLAGARCHLPGVRCHLPGALASIPPAPAAAWTAKNRMHFDLRAPGETAAEVRRLAVLGASVVRHDATHTVMQDPEGNEFCVEPGRAGAS
jgi:hypothetical protein